MIKIDVQGAVRSKYILKLSWSDGLGISLFQGLSYLIVKSVDLKNFLFSSWFGGLNLIVSYLFSVISYLLALFLIFLNIFLVYIGYIGVG